jgi:hypothetical protein
MQIKHWNEYEIYFKKAPQKKYTIMHPQSNEPRFVTPDTKVGLKIYALADKGKVLYVGTTNRPMASRLSFGLSSNGIHGYHGYKFKEKINYPFKLKVFTFDKMNREEIESIEAELVYKFRKKTHSWPMFQTEIHFNNKLCNHRIIDDIYKIISNL